MRLVLRASVASFALLVAGFAAGFVRANDAPAKGTSNDTIRQQGEALVKALKETPGCLGVESGQTASGKAVIFAFFENKKAVLKWYYSPTHRQLIDMLGADYDGKRTPLKSVPDDVPVMAVASIKFGGKPASPKTKMPVSQISIEVYTPLTAGLSIGGGFAPEAFRALAPKPAAKAATPE